ncbi:TPA: AbiJ-NTD4 domain-containing protein [Bacillus thuringiensis]|uniref:HEPN AbiJ-N-terminal domain-containing protein n=1 Tax=Bacillus thuringiensis TaxID=1428 RepID=A0A9X6KS93_BACTU|nr:MULTISPECIES: hypothetical protein [Bacillus cereus group]AJA21680.1 hypothetical protein BT4G5_23340 [Bacillus thuringiensis serovar galleriae]ETE93222.1 hypothetical protein C621_0209620 [Bacillus thuringiensis serovar aizawai str. Leapi01]ETE95845.1 hypothetical protein C623_0221160 [Bacillus thuringiensis serovar aizawai str. Hu4-2]KAB1381896.1 hypothetical protein FPG93_01615 [Bacillus thuringiensis]KLA09852.1 hypothetical protein B4158_5235 [Bacillus cereus]
MRFSERMGFTPVKELIQVDSMDDDLRVGLWNTFNSVIIDSYTARVPFPYIQTSNHRDFFEKFIVHQWGNYFKYPLTQLPGEFHRWFDNIHEYFFSTEWYNVYDFMEFLVQNYEIEYIVDEFKTECNKILERELSAYRFVQNTLVRINSQQEMDSIENAINFNSSKTFVDMHIAQALRLMANRENPDYINSIKESISAVESICKVIANDEKGTLGQALGKLEQKGVVIHDTLKEGFKRIYWYTSDGDGIRHAHKDVPNVSFEDAQFMLVTCSAFCNYLIEKANKVGIDLS